MPRYSLRAARLNVVAEVDLGFEARRLYVTASAGIGVGEPVAVQASLDDAVEECTAS